MNIYVAVKYYVALKRLNTKVCNVSAVSVTLLSLDVDFYFVVAMIVINKIAANYVVLACFKCCWLRVFLVGFLLV